MNEIYESGKIKRDFLDSQKNWKSRKVTMLKTRIGTANKKMKKNLELSKCRSRKN